MSFITLSNPYKDAHVAGKYWVRIACRDCMRENKLTIAVPSMHTMADVQDRIEYALQHHVCSCVTKMPTRPVPENARAGKTQSFLAVACSIEGGDAAVQETLRNFATAKDAGTAIEIIYTVLWALERKGLIYSENLP